MDQTKKLMELCLLVRSRINEILLMTADYFLNAVGNRSLRPWLRFDGFAKRYESKLLEKYQTAREP